ncbi:MAG: glycosyltransferase family 2 protein [Planctomycetota bacterium]|jgi:glycosyltransferase involved in cell wall biosynthesis
MAGMLSIVIPALNEEAAIGGVVGACLDAEGPVCEAGGVDGVEVIVVDDGSTDRTAEIVSGLAESHESLRLVSHETNLGYGAALKTGFREAKGEFLGFLDGDDTCDPRSFGALLAKLKASEADLAIGARLGPGTRMPFIRRVGNRFFACVLRVLSGRRVSDAASGQRVFRRTLVPELEGLPDGLNFTPAMSSRVAFDAEMKLVEVPIPYGERAGRSKLGVVRDGWRFLRVILETALGYRPGPFFYVFALVLWGFALGYGLGPLDHYAQTRTVPEDYIQRLLAVFTAGVAGLVFFLSGTASQRLAHIVHGLPPPPFRGVRGLAKRLVAGLPGTRAALLVLAAAALLAGPAVTWIRTGKTEAHWSLVLTGLLLFLMAAVYAAFFIQDRMISRWEARRRRGPARRPSA